MAEDKFKDQTYFLAEIKKEVLSKIKFPLAKFNKTEIREIANRIKLPNANKKDSVGICFIGKRNFPDFISNYLEDQPGDIVKKETGEVVGKHRGVLFYTIGQRRGLDLGGQSMPHYVSEKDLDKNILYVSAGDAEEVLFTKSIKARNFNDLSDDISKIKNDIIIKTRHSEVTYPGKIISTDGNNIEIESYEPIKFVTPGQELVLYQDDICLGGGEIVDEL
jgi:tRNA-specific 2-thiouridylase